jgi:hypothetical protein
MKTILISSTLVTTALAGFMLLAPNRASASTAHARFATMRSALRQALKDGEVTVICDRGDQNRATFTVLFNGSHLPPAIPVNISREEKDGLVDYTIQVDLSDDNFSSISFGKNQDSLVLVPKSHSNRVDTVQLDPKTGKPLSWCEIETGSATPVFSTTYRTALTQPGKATLPQTPTEDVELGDKLTLHMWFKAK